MVLPSREASEVTFTNRLIRLRSFRVFDSIVSTISVTLWNSNFIIIIEYIIFWNSYVILITVCTITLYALFHFNLLYALLLCMHYFILIAVCTISF
jgi:hypothetical protein